MSDPTSPIDGGLPSKRDDAITSQVRRPIADDLTPGRDAPRSGDVADAAEQDKSDRRSDRRTPRSDRA